MKKHYRRLVVGATYYGCGLAATVPDDTLVVEPSILVGSDFSLNFNPGYNWDYQPSNPEARKFMDELVSRNILSGQQLHQPAMVPVFSKWCLDHNLDIALSTRVLEHDDKHAVLFDAEGRHDITFDEFIDATSRREAKRITASLHSDGPQCAGQYDGYKIVAGRFKHEAFLLMPIPLDTLWPDARMALFNIWQTRPEKLAQCEIAAVGLRFDYNNYPNPVVALDRGLNGGELCTTM